MLAKHSKNKLSAFKFESSSFKFSTASASRFSDFPWGEEVPKIPASQCPEIHGFSQTGFSRITREVIGKAIKLQHELSSLIDSLCRSKKLREAIKLALSHTWEPQQCSVYAKIIQLCTELKSVESGRLIHGRIITNGFPANASLSTGLIIFYTKNGELGNARKVFDRMPDRSVVTWTALISGYCRHADYEEALRVFSAMHVEGVKPNQFTYGSALSACTRLCCLDSGMQIQGCTQKSRFADNLFVQSALVDFHSKCGKMEDACRVFESMETRDSVSWNAMIGGYVVQGMRRDAFVAFNRMLREGMRPDAFTFGSVLRAISGNANIFHGYIVQFGFGSHRFLNGSLIDAYARCGDLDSAIRVHEMHTTDLVSCTSLINGLVYNDTNFTLALRLFSQVRKNTTIDGILLCSMINICAKTASLSLGRQLHGHALKYQNRNDIATSNALIDMYSKSGAIEDAKRVFDEMEGKNVISWMSLITGYGKHGYGREAFALYLRMQEEGLKPNDVTFLSVLFACSHSGLTVEGWKCFSNMVREYGIVPRVEHYSCLADLVGRAGRLEEAYDLICRVRVCGDSENSVSVLGAGLGEVVGRRLFSLQPENPGNYVALSGIYAAVGLWDRARETRMLLENRTSSKLPAHSLCSNMSL